MACLLALVGHEGAARAGDRGVGVHHQPLALVLAQDRQEVQTCFRMCDSQGLCKSFYRV